MAPIRRQRLRKATHRFDPTALREALADGKVHASLALVVQEGASHFEVVEGADVHVFVELQPSGVTCTARLAGSGIYSIPPVGAEVVVLVPDGEIEAGPVIVARTGEAPGGLAPDTLVVVAPAGGRVLVHDGTAAEAKKLVTLDEFEAHVTWAQNHVHGEVVAPGSPPTYALTTPPATTPPPSFTPDPPPTPSGTDVLRAK